MQIKMQGMALVMMLFILAMMTIVVTWVTDELLLSVRRAENLRDSAQVHQLSIGSELWGLSVLTRDRTETETDHLNESWHNLGQGVKVENGTLDTSIIDEQSKFNLNNLYSEVAATTQVPGQAAAAPIWTPAFQRLLTVLELDPGLANAVLDWLDQDQNVRGSSGAEDSDYLSLEPPYRAANRMLSDVSELLWIKGFDQETVSRLSPYVSALPDSGIGININTASVPLLRILGKEILSEHEAMTLAEDRSRVEGYKVSEFLDHDMMAGEQDIATPLITDSSDYFSVHSIAKYGRASRHLVSTVKRQADKSIVIQRRRVLY